MKVPSWFHDVSQFADISGQPFLCLHRFRPIWQLNCDVARQFLYFRQSPRTTATVPLKLSSQPLWWSRPFIILRRQTTQSSLLNMTKKFYFWKNDIPSALCRDCYFLRRNSNAPIPIKAIVIGSGIMFNYPLKPSDVGCWGLWYIKLVKLSSWLKLGSPQAEYPH